MLTVKPHDPADIARLRPHNQQIAHATFGTPGELVAWMGAVQAQSFPGRIPGSKWAVEGLIH